VDITKAEAAVDTVAEAAEAEATTKVAEAGTGSTNFKVTITKYFKGS
jgi:hypothetical protein